MPNLINDILIRSGALQNIVAQNSYSWFDNVSIKELLLHVLAPLFIIFFTAFMLKKRYDERQRRMRYSYRNLHSTDFSDDDY